MSTIEMYLILNGVGYLLLGALCLFRPKQCSELIGLSLQGKKGLAEFSAVYGGLELGLGSFYLAASSITDLQHAALIFSLCLYSGIVFGRSLSIYRHGLEIGALWILFVLEILLLVWAVLLL